jgi:hypothetical protein
MTTNLITRKNNKMQLNGNLLTGETFEIKSYIKTYFDGKWDKESKGWIVNVEKVNNTLAIANSIGLRIDDTAATTEKQSTHSMVWQRNGELTEDY